MDKSTVIKNNFEESIKLKKTVLLDKLIIEKTESIVNLIIESYNNNGKVLFCGNGGSAADAQHLSAELSGRYYYDRPPLNSEALHVNTSYITAVANDYSFDEVYARLIKAVGNKGDVLIGLSTSGNSRNVIKALIEAKNQGCITVGLTGAGGGDMKACCDILIKIPSINTPRIQECHMLIGHSICELVEQGLFPKEK
jgi:D-sedoheptulose 7-phosphate isomerase